MSNSTQTNTPDGVLCGKDTQNINAQQGFSLLDRVRQTNENAGETLPDELREVVFDYSQEYHEPEPIYKQGDTPIFTRGNISCISGKAKSRKSFLIALFAGEILKEGGKVLLIDTEQAKHNVAKTAKRILATAGLPTDTTTPDFNLIALREKGTKERCDLTQQAIKFWHPDIVFLDGLRDLVFSINDEAEATEICNTLMALSTTTNAHICTVLHENKKDNDTRGHIGTEIMNKSETVITVSKEGENSKVEPKVCRNIDFKPFCFTVDNSQCPATPKIVPAYELPTELEKKAELYKKAFANRQELSNTDLVKYLTNNCYNNEGEHIKESAAKQRIKRATERDKILIKQENGLYCLNPIYQDDEPEREYTNYYETEKDDETAP